MLTKAQGNYHFLNSGSGYPFCDAVIADPGFEIVRATLESAMPYEAGFAEVERYLQALGRPPQALCGVELRCAKPYSMAGFTDFNRDYAAILSAWGLYDASSGVGCTARTNVAPTVEPPTEQVLYAFSYTVPFDGDRRTFVVSGATAGTQSAVMTLDEKVARILRTLESRLAELGVTWDDTTETIAYAATDIESALREHVLPRIGGAVRNGVRWFPSEAPIEGTEVELGTQGLRQEVRVSL